MNDPGLHCSLKLNLFSSGQRSVPDLGLEQPRLLAVQLSPSSRDRIQTPDEIVDLLGGLVQVQLGHFRFVHHRVVSGADFRLRDDRRALLGDEVDGLRHGLDADGVHEVVVQAVHRVVLTDLALPLEQDRSSIKSIVSPKDAESSFLVSLDQSPTDRRGSPMSW